MKSCYVRIVAAWIQTEHGASHNRYNIITKAFLTNFRQRQCHLFSARKSSTSAQDAIILIQTFNDLYKDNNGLFVTSWIGVPPSPARPREPPPALSWAGTRETHEKQSTEFRSRGFAPQKSGISHSVRLGAHALREPACPPKSCEPRDAASVCSASAQRATQVLPNRVWPSICRSHGEKQQSKLLGLPFL